MTSHGIALAMDLADDLPVYVSTVNGLEIVEIIVIETRHRAVHRLNENGAENYDFSQGDETEKKYGFLIVEEENDVPGVILISKSFAC